MATIKLKAAQAVELLAKMGVTAELVADDATDADFNIDTALQAIDANREPIISQKIKPALNDELHGSITAKVSHSARKAISELTGIAVKDLEGKDVAEALKLGFTHFSKTTGGDKEAVMQQLQDVMAAHTKELETERNARKGDKDTYDRELARFGVSNALGHIYASAKQLGDKANKAVLQDDFHGYLDRTYVTRLADDKKTILLYDMKDPSKLALNESNTQTLNIADLHKKFHSERGQWHEDNRSEKAKDHLSQVKPHAVKADNGQILSSREQQIATFADL